MFDETLNLLEKHKRVFLTSAAGCGKTYITKQIIEHYIAREKSVGITASTGLSARGLHNTGRTIHSFLAVGISNSIADFKSSKYSFAKPKTPIVSLDLLIIDEISMISADFLDLIMHRLENLNFSGKILIMGDFLQLGVIENKIGADGRTLESKYAFESKHFQTFKPILLTENKRVVPGHDNFMMLLNRVRYGEFNHYDQQEIAKYQILDPDPENKTVLVATNAEATTYNMKELEKIQSELLHNIGYWTELINPLQKGMKLDKLKTDLLKNIIPPETFVYKIGCKVLITSNDIKNGEYVNGDRGTVIEDGNERIVVRLLRGVDVIITPKEFDISYMKGNTEVKVCSFIQFPLVLASSITIHKSQGLSIEQLDIDCSKIFAQAQFYVALSRASNPDFLGILNFNDRLVRANGKAVAYYRQLERSVNG